MSELNTTPAPTPETDKATVTTDWMTGKPVVPADFARRLERERDEAMKFAEKRAKDAKTEGQPYDAKAHNSLQP